MRVLSWDIGIYNLSFCDIELIDIGTINKNSTINDNKELSVIIHDWGIIPLIKKYCDVCGVNAVYRNSQDFLCNKHWKEIEEGHIKDLFVRIGKEKCCEKIKTGKPCSRKPNWLYLDKYYCTTHLDNDKQSSSIPLTNQTKDLNYLSKRIFEMCSYLIDVDYDAILFENQPSLKNPTMKSIQIILYTFFHHSYYKKDSSVDLQFISAANKLKVYDGESFHVKANNKYTENKKLGILHTNYFLEKIPENSEKDWKLYLDKHSKKDDLCDSFLQALYFFKIIKKKEIFLNKEL